MANGIHVDLSIVKLEPDSRFFLAQEEIEFPPVQKIKEEIEIEEHDVLEHPRVFACMELATDKKIGNLTKSFCEPTPQTRLGSIEGCRIKTEEPILDESFFNCKVVLKDCISELHQSGRFCPNCAVLFPSCKTLAVHNDTSKHIKALSKKVKCNLCEYRCRDNGTLKKHIYTHTKEKPFECNMCDYKTTQSNHLQRHMLIHTKQKPFVCDFCNYSSSDKSSLNKHQRTHTKERPYKCHLCKYTATQNAHLKYHILTHLEPSSKIAKNSATIFECNMCKYKSLQKVTFKNHLLTHSSDKLFICKQCEYVSTQIGNFRKHMLTHSNARPFKCNVCDYTCKRSDHLNSHLKVHGIFNRKVEH